MSTPDFQDTNRPVQIAVPVVEKEFQLRLMDWRRLHREVSDIPQHSSFYSGLAFTVGGISASALFAFMGFCFTGDNPTWIKLASLFTFIATGIISWISSRMSRDKDLQVKSTVERVQKDMAEIHQRCFPGKKIEED